MEQALTEIVQRLKEGDEKAFQEIYHRYVAKLHAFVLRITKSSALADDLVQDIFVNLWEMRESLDAEKNFRSFLFTITRNHVINVLKRASVDSSLLKEIFQHTPTSSNSTEAQLEYAETAELLHKAIDLLPPQQKRVFELCKLNGMSYEEAAVTLNISPGTINAHMVKSMKFIKAYFNNHENIVAALLIHLFL